MTRPGRAGIPRTLGFNSASSSPRVALKPLLNGSAKHGRIGHNPLYVFYGSNTGTSESFAQRIASDAQAHGTQIVVVSNRTKIGPCRFPGEIRRS